MSKRSPQAKRPRRGATIDGGAMAGDTRASCSLLAARQRIVESDSRDRPRVIIREPDGAVADTKGVSSRSGPMTAQRYGGRIDRRQRNLRHRGPNHSAAETDVAAMPRRTQSNGLGGMVARIDTCQRSVTLVERPYCLTMG